jgi:undecaprenyl-diphosphatase
VWVWAWTHTHPTIHAWEAAGPFSSVGAIVYHAVKWCGTLWVPAAVGALIVLGGFVQSDPARVRRAVRNGLLVFACPAIAGGAAEVLKLLLRRVRPEVSAGWYGFRVTDFWSTSGLGLPSSHAAPAVALAMALAMVWPRWAGVFAAAAALCCISRVLAGAHFVSDAYAGVFVGVVAARLVMRVGGEKATGNRQ